MDEVVLTNSIMIIGFVLVLFAFYYEQIKRKESVDEVF